MHTAQYHREQAAKHLAIAADLEGPMTPRNAIATAICSAFGVTREQLFSTLKRKQVARARAAFSWIARNVIEPRPSYPDIARWHGGRMDHSTVMYHLEAVEKWKQTDEGTGRVLMKAVDRVRILLDIPAK